MNKIKNLEEWVGLGNMNLSGTEYNNNNYYLKTSMQWVIPMVALIFWHFLGLKFQRFAIPTDVIFHWKY